MKTSLYSFLLINLNPKNDPKTTWSNKYIMNTEVFNWLVIVTLLGVGSFLFIDSGRQVVSHEKTTMPILVKQL
ncbi:MAG: hypothetical protein QNJ31_04325 [Candidatus Caenarcaniphilales bacterium]|nr:hypothetical protein [Candidatus Caenarcaniphilales bacterium]